MYKQIPFPYPLNPKEGHFIIPDHQLLGANTVINLPREPLVNSGIDRSQPRGDWD